MRTRLQKQKNCRYRIFNFFANARLYFWAISANRAFAKKIFVLFRFLSHFIVFLTIEVNLHSKGVWYWTNHLQFNHVSKLGAGRGLFGHITPFKQQREWVCCLYLCALNTAVYFTQKQKNVSKMAQSASIRSWTGSIRKKNWGLKNTQSKTKLWTKEYHGEYNISSTHVTRSKFEITWKCLSYFVTSIQNTNRERAA